MPRKDDAQLWRNYNADRTDANRNAILEFHWPRISRYVSIILAKQGLGGLIPEALSYAAERALKVAIPGYDPSRGTRFTTHLASNVRFACLDCQRACDPVSKSQRMIRRVVEETAVQLAHELGHRPTDAEVAEAAMVDEQMVIECEVDPIPQEWGDWLEYKQWDMEITTAKGEATESLFVGLPYRTKSMLCKYFLESYTMKEVGEMYGLSESRVSQIFSNARKFLKESRAASDYMSDIT